MVFAINSVLFNSFLLITAIFGGKNLGFDVELLISVINVWINVRVGKGKLLQHERKQQDAFQHQKTSVS